MSHMPENNSWQACRYCGKHVHKLQWHPNYRCPFCGQLQRLTIKQRLRITIDADSWQSFETVGTSTDFLDFPGYTEKLKRAQDKTGEAEAMCAGTAKIGGFPVVIGVMDSHFMMGTLNTTIGAVIKQAMAESVARKLPLILFVASGGARMQEGIFSLLQMNTILNQWSQLEDSKNLVVNILTDPTMGGVSASFGFKADYVLAEDHAQIGFAGKRVIAQTTHEQLSDTFQTAEDLLAHGLVDQVIQREKVRSQLITLLRIHFGGNHA
ncbi:Acetyl-coenzyme A carboxyl transferase beta chain [Pediococcus damnosus]|uniref:Acetyl-coenzyme A carboxyl transferase beta chain n=1 Tax=Pediococcus damnosus TaxID=51663 RepID=A0A0R2HM29_9LACO|nr:acetyl-CoA carboxylase carboxyltransferase subunit beta [Pediococcus damnosus]AMV62645.1 Acetyl-coenzyme A carboxyl transferase beta chain [Pediococcus damnosus]AMV67473.1 Acetyl-coenzyme A carboxyl transferase beta chain [Pediococcus damnosus]AMV69171.1 Acetyl-coenzyme A carboxyl transferase beta chain [Pediococcus damnosus]KJU73810.1 acetyl-CoA carboxyl transferase [Pediococcus damnosus LMG 28219]KRN50570.1 accD protein [Pediococcus damnosus]